MLRHRGGGGGRKAGAVGRRVDGSGDGPCSRAALEVVAREAREAQVTLTAKTGAMATYDRAFTHFASSLFTA